ncbi:DUF4153 domain-containing protein [Flavobacterium sp.]|uniref:DUF4153 domain-containing protein n=1 Tax=Flavobacterium sp. TaxID=239 RepID=UPI0033405C0B
MKNKFSLVLSKITALVLNYPLVLLMSLATVIVIVYGIETNPNNVEEYLLLRLGITFALGISSQFALKMLAQRIKNGLVWQLTGILFLIGFFFVFPSEEKNFSEVYGFIIVPTFILSHLLVAFISFTKNENEETNFWQYNKNLFINLFLTAVFTGVLTSGVQLAILAVQELFNFDFKGEIYLETFAALSILGSTSIFLLFNESGLEYLEKEGSYPVVFKFFTQFILIPLLIIYVVILYFYCLKITINWELPRGWVSYLVLAYSIVGIFALLLVHPLHKEKAKSWIILFSKIFYYTLIPLIVLLFVAIFTRVLQYGYTEARYFVLLISVWLTTVVFYFIFSKRATIKFIPISLFAFGVFALIFPYINAFSVSKKSQENELKQILTNNKLMVNGLIDFKAPIADSLKNEVESKFEYLSQRSDKEYLKTFLNAETKALVEKDKYWYNGLFKNVTYTNKGVDNYVRIYTKKNTYEIKDYQYILNSENRGNIETTIGKDLINITNTYNYQNPTFEIKINEEVKDIMPQIKAFCNKYKSASKDVLVDDLSFTVDFKNYQIKILFNSINWYTKGNNYNFEETIYLVKSK